jgi:hypothetical protein
MWEVKGDPIDPSRFSHLKPDQILDEYDGPRIFTFTDDRQDSLLAFWCDGTGGSDRYLVVPFGTGLGENLTKGRISVREALDQPWLWIVDVDNSCRPVGAWRSSLGSVPEEVLPEPGTMLWPSLEPLLSVRAIGDRIKKGLTPASVIRDTIDSTEKALKILIEYILGQLQSAGRPARALRELYDLPGVGIGFASFEISFRPPSSDEQTSFNYLDESVQIDNAKIYVKVREMLERGLADLSKVTTTVTASDTDSDESRVILRAIEKLAPPSSGFVQSIELRGELVAGITKPHQPVKLRRGDRAIIKRRIRELSREAPEDCVLIGLIREFDKDASTFELREIENSGLTSQTFSYELEFEEEIFDACERNIRVRVIGVRETRDEKYAVVAISQLDDTQGQTN